MLYIKTANLLVKGMDYFFEDISRMGFSNNIIENSIKNNMNLIDSWYGSHSRSSFKDVLPIMTRIMELPPNHKNTSMATWGILWCTKKKDKLGLVIHMNIEEIEIKISPEVKQELALDFTNELKKLLLVHNWG